MIKIPPGPLSASNAKLLSDLLTRMENNSRVKGVAPILVQQSGNGPTLISSNIAPRMLIRLTGHEPFGEYDSGHSGAPPGYNPDSADYDDLYPDCRYSWYEVDIDPTTCGYIEVRGGRRGWVDRFPAVAIDGSKNLQEGTVVEAWLAPSGSHWRFSPGGGGGEGLVITVIDCAELVLVEDI